MIIRRLIDPSYQAWSPFEELDRLRRQFGHVMGTLSGQTEGAIRAGVFPPVNVTEDAQNYYLRAELPGIPAEELDISVTGNNVSIAGERKIHLEVEKQKYHRRERDSGKFSRGIALPTPVNAEKVTAELNSGILRITIEKTEEAKPKQIKVK